MSDVFDYLYWRGDLSLKSDPLNEIDSMILARLSYIPFEYAIDQNSNTDISILELSEMLISLPDLEDKVLIKEDVNLLIALSESSRFKNMKISKFVNQVDIKTQTQFSAITIQMDEQQYYVSFRGTDNTLIGWKEDFNMSFTFPVPAQKLAEQYLTQIANAKSGRFIIGGHSKGGNLAVYAAANCHSYIQKRIDAVYNFDGPGFNKKFLQTPGYINIDNLVHTFVPQSSIVGMLLEHEEKYTIVHSTQVFILQHDIYSWEVLPNKFESLESVTNSSKFIDSTLKAWIANMDYNQLEKFIDAIYMILAKTNVQTLKELSENWFANTKNIIKSLSDLDDETRIAITKTLFALMKSAKQEMFQSIKNGE